MLFLRDSLKVQPCANFLRCLLDAVGPRSMSLFSLMVGVRAWVFRRPAGEAALFLLASTILAACTVPPPVGSNEPPDAVDRIRAVDLQPRFPQSSATSDTGTGGNRPQLYYGSSSGQPSGPAAALPDS